MNRSSKTKIELTGDATAVDNRGQWQAQGNDCPSPKGHCLPWNSAQTLTKTQGLELLAQLSKLCSDGQRKLRTGACEEAKRYTRRAPSQGYPAFHMKTFLVRSPPQRAKKARIDFEVTSGAALRDDP